MSKDQTLYTSIHNIEIKVMSLARITRKENVSVATKDLEKVLSAAREYYETFDRVEEMENLLRSACAIAERKGKDTAWKRFIHSISMVNLNSVTPRTYKTLPSDEVIHGT